jgi:hypothetical protein
MAMSQDLEGLDRVEQWACQIVERALGGVATAHDVPPRQGAVDAFLAYTDGRWAAFEVTHLATDGGASLHLDQLLSRDRFGWPLPGKWWWSIWIGSPADLPRFRGVFDKIVLMCEGLGVTEPRLLPWAGVDADVRWLTRESSVQMWGYPNVPARDGDRLRRASITQPGLGGFADETLSQLDGALTAAFGTPLVRRHAAKLKRSGADERHLFVVVGVYDLPFSLFDALGFGDTLPANAPSLPVSLTHLWLAPVHGHRVLLGDQAGWREYEATPDSGPEN